MRDALRPSTLVSRSGGLVASAIGDEIVALNIETGTCYGLNAVGSRIWNLIEEPTPISRLCATLVAEYQVEPGVCQDEVMDLVEHLLEEGLVVVTSHR